MHIKHTLRRLIRAFGYGVPQAPKKSFGSDAFVDMTQFVDPDKSPVIFDIGGNVGQTVINFKKHFPKSLIYSFEPNPEAHQELARNVANMSDVQCRQFAVGSAVESKDFFVNSNSDMSSFLPLDTASWGSIREEIPVNTITVDQFCKDEQIEQVDILKSDTQGYELEVLLGAREMLESSRIGLVYLEVIFSKMYVGLPGFDQIFRFLTERDFLLVSCYDIHHRNRIAGWADVLFINRTWLER